MTAKLRTFVNWMQAGANAATIISAIVGIATLQEVQTTLKATRETLSNERETKVIDLSIQIRSTDGRCSARFPLEESSRHRHRCRDS